MLRPYHSDPKLSIVRKALGLASILLLTALAGCPQKGGGANNNSGVIPKPGEPLYNQMVSAFYAGTISLQSSEDKVAARELAKAVKLVPGEPAAWANLALMHLRLQDTISAKKELDQAASLLDKPNSDIEALFAALEDKTRDAQGHFEHQDSKMEHLKKAISIDPSNLRARYSLVTAIRESRNVDEKAIQEQLQAIQEQKPENLGALAELAVSTSSSGNIPLFQKCMDQLQARASSFPANALEMFQKAKKLVSDPLKANTFISFMRNDLKPFPLFKQDMSAINLDRTKLVGDPLPKLLKLVSPSAVPAAPDSALAFNSEAIKGVSGTWQIVRTVTLAAELPEDIANGRKLKTVSEAKPAILLANGTVVQFLAPDGKALPPIPFPGAANSVLRQESILSADLSYDFRPDLVLTGDKGFRLYVQTSEGVFKDATADTKLPATVLNAAYTGAYAADMDDDGDLDLILQGKGSAPTVLQNHGDGDYQVVKLFPGLPEVKGFVRADLDGDGEGDIAFLGSKGELHIYENKRGGQYKPWTPPTVDPLLAIAAADITARGTLDLIGLKADGSIVRMGRLVDGTWDVVEIAKWDSVPKDGSARLASADLDNNGGVDLVATGSDGTQVWLSDEKGKLSPLAAKTDVKSASIDLATISGTLDLYGVGADGKPVRLVNTPTKKYHWQAIRPRADFIAVSKGVRFVGSDRVNSFGVGGEAEMRAGLLYQKQSIVGPTVHFGLGENVQCDACRILWPNGTNQAEFPPDLKIDQIAMAKQRLDGSCPWLFAWDGKSMQMVTDCIWRSPLGLRINGQVTAGVAMTEDWLKLRNDQLVPHDGIYDLRISAELWETHFFDYLELLSVDHPAGTEIFTDERFAIPAPPLKVFLTTIPTPISKATDDVGTDVTDIVNKRDMRFLDTFGRGQYQGVTRDHYVEFEFGAECPVDQPIALIGNGWIHPTDSSINVALSQSNRDQPKSLSLEIPDGKGGWRSAKGNLGFPEGKIKNILVDLSGLFKKGATPYKMRLRTNLEIYWDFLAWAKILPSDPMKITKIPLASAELKYHGFSESSSKDTSSPEMGDYNHLAGSAGRWWDLEGFYTKYGEVKPLLTAKDDRYVIMNAGDELDLRFPENKTLPTGNYKRDYVLMGDGWVKDGNFNTTFNKTVLPLPTHKKASYDTPPTRLEDDPVYKAHKKDWEEWHTRYVEPSNFRNAFRP